MPAWDDVPEAELPDGDPIHLPTLLVEQLGVGSVVEGPALVEDEWSTTVVYPGQRCVADALGNLLIDTGARA